MVGLIQAAAVDVADVGAQDVIHAIDECVEPSRIAAIIRLAKNNGRGLIVFDTGGRRAVPRVDLPGAPPAVERLRIAPDGKHLAAILGRDEGFAVFEVRTGREVARAMPFDDTQAMALDWHPNGSSLVVGAGYEIEFWGFEDGALSRRTRHRAARVRGGWVGEVAFRSDGVLAVSTSDPATYLFSDRGAAGASLKPLAGGVGRAIWSDDGEVLVFQARGQGGSVHVWRNLARPEGAEHAHAFEPRSGAHYTAVAFRPGTHELAVADNRGQLDLYDAVSGALRQRLASDRDAPITHLSWRGNRLWAWANHPANQLRSWFDRETDSPRQPPEPTPTGDCTIKITLAGRRVGAVPGLWFAVLRGPAGTDTREDVTGEGVTFSNLVAGTYKVYFDTRGDVSWGPTPKVFVIECREGVEERTVRFD